MAERDVDIYIGIRVGTEELDKANTLLKELANNLEKIKGIAGVGVQPAATGTEQMNRELAKSPGLIKGISSSFSGLGTAFSSISEGSDTLRTSLLEVRGGAEGIRQALKILPADFDRAWSIAKEIPYSDWKTFGSLVKDIGSDLGYSGEELNKFVRESTAIRVVQRLGFDIDVGGLEKLRESLNLTEGQFNRAINVVKGLSGELDIQNLKWRSFQQGVHAFYGEMGPVGWAVERLAAQLYWLGIGTMFVSMSFARLEQRHVTAQARTLSLARAYRSTIDAQRDLTKAVMEYGPRSEEASGALGRAREAEESLRLAREQARMAIVQENLATVQLYLGAMPLMINFYRMGTTVALAVIAQNAAKAISSGKVAVANIMEAQSYIGLAQATHYATAAKIGLITMGAGLVISFGLMAWATADAAVRMAELDAEMKKLGTSFAGSTTRADTFAGSLAHGSVAEHARIARDEILSLVDSMREIGKISISDVEQKIIQEIFPVEVPELEDQYQIIYQILKEIEIPSVQDQNQIITQQLKQVQILKVEDQIQNIIQELQIIKVPMVQDQIQFINQKLREIKIPEIEEQIQNIVQILKSINIPNVENQEQLIVQTLRRIEIQKVPDQIQSIYQKLSEISIPRVQDETQIIKQQLIEAQIPIPQVENLTQTIVQKLEEVQIKNVPSMTQIITQVLEEAKIPEIKNIIQNIIQKLQEVNIKDVPSTTQLVNQQLKEVNIPNIEDSTQNIYQRLFETRIPEVEDQSQIIQQRLQQVLIPEVNDQIQNITQNLIKTNIPLINDQIQIIKQEVIEAEIPVPEEIDIIQNIVQEVTRARIETPEELHQKIMQVLEEAKIIFPEDIIQHIEQVLIPVKIPQVEDQAQTIRQEFEINMQSFGLGISILNLTSNALDNISKKFIETTKEVNKFSQALGPHSMVGSARQARQEMELLSSIMKVPEFRTALGINVVPLKIERKEALAPISIYAPIQVDVTDRRDIPNISEQIERGIVRAVRTRGRLQ